MAGSLEVLDAARLAFYDNKPTATLYNTVAPSIPNNSLAPVSWNSSTDDNWLGHNSGVNPSRYTIQVAGLYGLSGVASFAGSATGYRLAAWFKNGTEVTATRSYMPNPGTTINCSVGLPTFGIRLVVGDYIEMALYQNIGSPLTQAIDSSFMRVEFVHF